MKILLITPVLNIAGVPLAQMRFAKALKRNGHNVKLIVGHKDPNYMLDNHSELDIKILNKNKVSKMMLQTMKEIKNYKPEIIFTAEDHMTLTTLILLIIMRSKAKISGSSRVGALDLEAYGGKFFSRNWKSFFLKLIFKCVAWRADALTCVSEEMVPTYHEVLNSKKHKCVYNIIVDHESRDRALEPVTHKWISKKEFPLIIAAGRLDPPKGFADLVKAMSIIKDLSNAKLIILGDGPERMNLESQIIDEGLSENIDTLGYVSNPLKYFSRSDVFVLPSYAEGMPNVLVEAMMCGCTPVSTDCQTGPREVLQDGRYGYLVPIKNPKLMAEAILKAIKVPIKKNQLENAIAPFKEEEVISKHLSILGIPAKL